jgi:ribbon-helix-helix CopG family protein
MTRWEGDIVPTTVRLDPDTEAILRRLARKTGRTKSSIIREAILRLSEADAAPRPGGSLFDQFADLVGVGHGGPSDLASHSEEILRDLFARRHARR